MAKGRFQRKRRVSPIFLIIILLLAAMAAVLVSREWFTSDEPTVPTQTTANTSAATTEPTTEATTEPTTIPTTTVITEPYVVSTASIGVTGDVLIHSPVYNAALKGNNSFDFNDMFMYIGQYYDSFDFMVANLEVTLSGADRGYSGYPTFNCPDEIVDALKNAGVDLMLNSNNHTYDHGNYGFVRTQEVLREKEMLYLGTRPSEDIAPYLIQDINGIKVGMLCYTYETGQAFDGKKALNGIGVSSNDANLITSFNYDDLPGFYKELESNLAAMEADGADVSMVFIHWGEEYQLKPNQTQKEIAQALCNLGVDVIVGGHPHVIQPFEMLESDNGHRTFCIYSVGNALSNQRRTNISSSPDGHVEDGMIFGVTFEQWNDGSVNVSEINILPTWVNKEWRSAGNIYRIVPLDNEIAAWDCFDVSSPGYTYGSYKRTMAIVGEGLNACREALELPTVPLVHEAP